MAFDGKDDEATRILCQVIETLHRPRSEPPPNTLRPLGEWFRALNSARERHDVFAKAGALAEGLLAETESPAILHGDVTHQNVLGFGDKGWLAVDPKGLIGDRAYDYANIFRSPTTALTTPTRLRRQADVMAEYSGLESRTLLQWGFVHAALSVVWRLEDGQALTERALKIPRMNLAVLEAG
jgi:streptomycin 6-kinase